MKHTYDVFRELAELILFDKAKKATTFLSNRKVVKATRRGKIRKNERTTEILFTIGAPNYAEWKFIKKALKEHKNPWPITKIKYYKKGE